MTFLAIMSLDVLWRNALAAIPLAIIVAAICRWLPCRPSTRHALWVLVLISLLAPPKLPSVDWNAAWNRVATESMAFVSMLTTKSASVVDDPKQQAIAAWPRFDAPDMPVVTQSQVEATPVVAEYSRPSPPSASTALKSAVEPSIRSTYRTSVPRQRVATVTPQRIDETAKTFVPRNESSRPAFEVSANAASIECAQTALTCQSTEPECNEHAEMRCEGNVQSAPTFIVTHPAAQIQQDPRCEVVLFSDMASFGPGSKSDLDSQARALEDFIVMLGSQFAAMWRETGAIWTQRAWESTRQWTTQVVSVGRSVAGVQPIPAAVWIGGCMVIAAVMLGRIVRFQQLLRKARPAPVQLRRAVAEAAVSIGLRNAPRTLVVDDRVSPLVWCGRERILIIPRPLWNDLDDLGRNAVILHELAHIKRRDHWVCWIEMIVGAVYWWHPLVWLIRHRLRDEADRCCDAWVTSLLPATTQRGAYARALLTTRKFLGTSRLDTPAMGLGVTSAKARQFARRLTMVMTERSNPGMSMMGAALTVCVAAAAFLSAPLLACPPEDKPTAAKAPKVTARVAPRTAVRAPTPPTPPAPPAHPSPPAPPMPDDASTFERYMKERAEQGAFAPGAMGEEMELRMRLETLEQRLNRMSEHLERMLQSPQPGAPKGLGGGLSVAPRVMVAPSAQGQRGAVAWAGPSGVIAASPSGDVAFFGPDGGEEVIRFYQLPEGKLKALTELMARSDVPVLITPMDNGIQVHGTPRQHAIFAAFVQMIHPEAKLPAGGGASAATADKLRRELEVARVRGQAQMEQARGASRKAFEERQRAIDVQRSRMRQKAQELYRKAQEIESRADAMSDEAEDSRDEQQDRLLAQADALYAQASAIETEADALDEAADGLEDELDALLEDLELHDEEIQELLERELEMLEREAELAARAADTARMIESDIDNEDDCSAR